MFFDKNEIFLFFFGRKKKTEISSKQFFFLYVGAAVVKDGLAVKLNVGFNLTSEDAIDRVKLGANVLIVEFLQKK